MSNQYNTDRPYSAQNRPVREGASRPNASGPRHGSARPTPPSGQRRPGGQPQKRRPAKKRRNSGRLALILLVIAVIVAAAAFAVVKLVLPGNDPAVPVATITDPTSTPDVSHSDQLAALMENTEAPAMAASSDGVTYDAEGNVVLPYGQIVEIQDVAAVQGLSEDWLNVLLLGSDARDLVNSARTDSMIICSINLKTGEVKLSSIMRDLAVEFDELGDHNGTYRINNANYFGGEELAMRVVNECFDLNIENFVHVNFFGFQQIAQAMGGVEMDITKEEMEEINISIVEQAKAAWKQGIDESALPNEYLETYGKNTHLDGRQTLAYARIRKQDGGDYARAERQRKVLVALMNKLKDMNSADMLRLLNTAAPHFRTNMSLDTILSVAIKVVQNGLGDVKSFRLPVNGSYNQTTRDGQSMLYDCDWDKNTNELHYFIYG